MKPSSESTRRTFLQTSALAAAAATTLEFAPAVHAGGGDGIKVGLIGCGGRGSGAMDDVLNADANVKVVALADMFEEQIKRVKETFSGRIDVPDNRCFTGFDAYKQLLATDVNYVILATPPGFRPTHLTAAVAAGKNIFAEKPVAVDGPGIRECLKAYEEAQKKNLRIAAGTQRRHQTSYLEMMEQIKQGGIGQIVAGRAYWNMGKLWEKLRTPQMSEMEWQIRNWYYYTWLSGDHIVEQHVHNLDVFNWATGAHPTRAVALAGREVRTDTQKFGNIFDHFAIDYEYPKGVHLLSMCRQIEGCESNISEAIVGTKGTATTVRGNQIMDLEGKPVWKFGSRDQENKPYIQEHKDLIAAIRDNKPLNELKNVAESTLTAIMGRMSAYTGKAITWDMALNSKQHLAPEKLAFGDAPIPEVSVPGKTKFV